MRLLPTLASQGRVGTENKTMPIITRKFWCCNAGATKALTVDVRTNINVSEAQAQANAEDFAARKFGNCTYARLSKNSSKSQYSIGPRR